MGCVQRLEEFQKLKGNICYIIQLTLNYETFCLEFIIYFFKTKSVAQLEKMIMSSDILHKTSVE